MTQASNTYYAEYSPEGKIISVGQVFGGVQVGYTNTVRPITEVEYNQFVEANKSEPLFPDEQRP